MEPRVDHLLGLLQDLDQVLGLGSVGWREEGVGRPSSVLPAGPSNPVNVVLGVVRIVIVDHELHIVNVQSPASDKFVQLRKNHLTLTPGLVTNSILFC